MLVQPENECLALDYNLQYYSRRTLYTVGIIIFIAYNGPSVRNHCNILNRVDRESVEYKSRLCNAYFIFI